ncbi:MAG: hypothetical protein ACI85O_000859 [Saprospiraceae bacterium]|jgi:hypothetical protein
MHSIYTSCGNRNCPICPALKKETWLQKRSADLLPVKYYHVVFTLPHTLNILCANHPREMYNLLFRCAWKSLNELMLKPKWCGAQTGMTAVLHTWGQQMMLHPHLHCIVPAGGLSKDKKSWIYVKNKTVLVDEKTLMNDFKSLYINGLKETIENENFCFTGEAHQYGDATEREKLYAEITKKKWAVWLKSPDVGPQQTLEYLSRYVNSVAISESQILKITDDSILIEYKNYAKENADGLPEKEKMSLTDEQFFKRFLTHVLPPRFHRIRYYGLHHPRNRKTKLAICQKLLNVLITLVSVAQIQFFLFKKLGIDPTVCRVCGSPNRVVYDLISDKVLHRKIVDFPQFAKPPPTVFQKPPAGCVIDF